MCEKNSNDKKFNFKIITKDKPVKKLFNSILKMSKTAILIGYGGMGRRYHQALKLMKINVIAICDKKINQKDKNNFEKKTIFTTDYKTLSSFKADLLCVASNTQSRLKIISFFADLEI